MEDLRAGSGTRKSPRNSSKLSDQPARMKFLRTRRADWRMGRGASSEAASVQRVGAKSVLGCQLHRLSTKMHRHPLLCSKLVRPTGIVIEVFKLVLCLSSCGVFCIDRLLQQAHHVLIHFGWS